jgi:uncharacterized protein YkwD
MKELTMNKEGLGLCSAGAMKPLSAAVVLYSVVCIGLIVEPRNLSALTQDNPSITSSTLLAIRQTASAARPVKEEHYSELVAQVHQQVNEFRRDQGLKPLTLDPIISAQAREHSADMARNGKAISHRGFNQRLQDIRKEIPYRAAAENLAASAGSENPARTAVEGWKNSPEHRKNMLGDFSLTGIGIAQSKEGTYFFTQIFLKPLK